MIDRPARESSAHAHLRTNAHPIEKSDLAGMRTAFGVDNAKQMDIAATVRYFVPPANFQRLFTAKNHILLGSRGSGKTTWIRMLAHDHVALAAKDPGERTQYARNALANNLIGVYVPTSAGFAGDLKNKSWQTEAEAEQYFSWRLNLYICSAFTHIIPSCIRQYVKSEGDLDAALATICKELAKVWSEEKEECTTVEKLQLLLSSVELRHQAAIRRARTSSRATDPHLDHFDSDLLLPFRHAINVVKAHITIPQNTVWMICLDEVEYLSEIHHRILNSQIRASNSDIVFKIATMPFAHHTLATNFGDPVREGNDFEYINVDQEAIDGRGALAEGEFLKFARAMFQRRVAAQKPQFHRLTLKALLGPSELIENKSIQTPEEYAQFFTLLKKHANPSTVARAERLRDKDAKKFKSEIVRKIHGALLLKEAISGSHGNARLKVYCGEAMVIRCCDGNARRLMRVINQLVQKIELDGGGNAILPLDPAVQNSILESLARDTLNRVYSEPPNGAVVSAYLTQVGRFMEWQFSSTSRLLGSDQITSIRITDDDGPEAQKFIRQAIQLSLMIPSSGITLTASNRPCFGVFHLAFVFAPLFHLLPRRNDSVRLSKVLASGAIKQDSTLEKQQPLL